MHGTDHQRTYVRHIRSVSRRMHWNLHVSTLPTPKTFNQTSLFVEETSCNRSGFHIYKTAQLLCILSFIYLVSGLWLGGQVNIPRGSFFLYGGLILSIWWLLRDYVLKVVSSKKSKKLQIWIYCLVPWCRLSKWWGKLAGLHLPVVIRVYVFIVYCKCFSVNIREIEYPLKCYTSLSSFFTRRLTRNARNIDPSGCLVIPCDGTVVYCGNLFGKQIKQVKGIDYYVNNFLGYNPMTIKTKTDTGISTRLYHCVLYLAPGDYHRFHSPCNWTVLKRSHFHGQLLSVAPKLVKWFPSLLSLNERVVYSGRWKHGFFSYTAVGATNVGSIIVHKDPDLNTNKSKKNTGDHVVFNSPYGLVKGEEMGLFTMGSTIVLIFEAPETFHFSYNINDRVKLGSKFGTLKKVDANGSYGAYECHECNATSFSNIDSFTK
ncbi:phosphatidylserine decarboxylase proenzyme, mitochondrial-like isoform X2 [Arctopsyche grandis]|uniref:phosphatidylserine decarboxylase proenzyme, mitochondrial-like isoform X2 n=1 Tax=Arctopsyche grandis TaxID=121162 RepID=UPI00406D9E23